MTLSPQHDRFVGLLFERAGLDGYPSPMMLSRLERAITTREDADAYLDALLDVVERDRHPSPMMIERAFAVVQALALVDQVADPPGREVTQQAS